MKVIGVAGQLANGKDIFAEWIVETLNKKSGTDAWRRCAFADGLKRVLYESFNLDREFAEEWKRKPEPPDGFKMTIRQALQFIGDGFRQIKPSVWVDWTLNNCGEQAVISDVRYINELKAVRNHGGINIVVYRPGFENDIDHPSESQVWKIVDFYRNRVDEGIVTGMFMLGTENMPPGTELIDLFVRNNGSILEFKRKVEEFVLPLVDSHWKKQVGLTHIKKGWGSETWLVNNDLYCGKILKFNQNFRCSWHLHWIKDETFFLVRGKLRIIYGDVDNIAESHEMMLNPGETFHVPPGMRHQMIAEEDSEMIEISTHHEESDSIRIIKGD